jgi:hypothetical protein
MTDDRDQTANAIIISMCAKMLDSIESHVKLVSLIAIVNDRKAKRHRVFLMETVLSILDYALTMEPPEHALATLTELKHRMQTMRESDLAALAHM